MPLARLGFDGEYFAGTVMQTIKMRRASGTSLLVEPRGCVLRGGGAQFVDSPNGEAAPVINLMGELVMLGPMEREQIPVYQRWLNNFDTLRTQGEPSPMPDTIANMTRWYESYVTGRDDVAWFTIYERSTAVSVGWTELKDIDHRHGTAEFAIMIGEPEARGKGYGTDTARLMLRYGFEHLGLHNIHLYYMEFNPAARRAYEKAGFSEYGRRSQAHVSGGRRWDVVYMQCLATDEHG